MVGFIFGGNTGLSYSDLQKRRAAEEAAYRQQSARSPRNLGEGLTALGRGLAYGLQQRAAQREMDAKRKGATTAWDGVFGAGPTEGEQGYGVLANAGQAAPSIGDIPVDRLMEVAPHMDALPKTQQSIFAALLQAKLKGLEPPDPLEDERKARAMGKTLEQFYEWQHQQRIAERQAGRTTVSNIMGGGVNVPDYSPLPKGYVYLRNPDGSIQIDERGLPRIAPIPGSEAERGIAAEAEKEAKAAESKGQTAQIVLEDINRAVDAIRSAPNYAPVTGFLGSLFANIPGSGAYDLKALTQTLRGNIGFDRLQRMREESKTGGALGGISQQEMDLLSSVLGSLDTAQSQDQLLRNMERLADIYTQIAVKAAAYDDAAKYGFGQGGDIGNGITAVPTDKDRPVRKRYNPKTGELETVR